MYTLCNKPLKIVFNKSICCCSTVNLLATVMLLIYKICLSLKIEVKKNFFNGHLLAFNTNKIL